MSLTLAAARPYGWGSVTSTQWVSVHYDSCEVDYRQLKDDIAAILSGEMRFLAAFAGDGDFLS